MLKSLIIPLLVLVASCGNPLDPAVRTPAPSPAPEPVNSSPAYTPTWPVISQPARVYEREPEPGSPYHGSKVYSRYVLYDDHRFALQYSSANYPFFEYRGTYTESSGRIDFSWEGWSTAGPWARQIAAALEAAHEREGRHEAADGANHGRGSNDGDYEPSRGARADPRSIRSSLRRPADGVQVLGRIIRGA